MLEPERNTRPSGQPLARRERRAWRWWLAGILILAIVRGGGLLMLPLTGEGIDPIPEEAIGQTPPNGQ